MLTILERYGSPALIRTAGRRRLITQIRPEAPRMTERPVQDTLTAPDEQTVPGTDAAAATTVPSLTGQLHAHLSQRAALEPQTAALLETHPLPQLLTSMPGTGVRTGTHTPTDTGHTTTYATARHLPPPTRTPATRNSNSNSNSTTRSEQPSKQRNKQPKHTFHLTAWGLPRVRGHWLSYGDDRRG